MKIFSVQKKETKIYSFETEAEDEADALDNFKSHWADCKDYEKERLVTYGTHTYLLTEVVDE